jgi:2-amino-4-hydroxy-6-hydroxymethyldihydropteridine diphosphokinase
VYETEAVGFKGDPFYNLVAAFDTEAPVEDIHRELARLEAEHGRRREAATAPSLARGPRLGPIVEGMPKFSARTLDIDILLYGNLIRHDRDFDIPRGEIGRYTFVLGPLAEIAPDLRHPETGTSIGEMWRRFSPTERQLHPVPLSLDLKSR